MDQLPKNNRIVSKGQYVKAQSKRIGVGASGCGLLLLATICAGATIWLLVFLLLGWWTALGAVLCVASGVATFWLGKWGFDNLRHAEAIDPGIPLTRKVAATLPSNESLVRASEEPTQEQQIVLLRAATHDHTTPAEQLLKPSGEPE